MNTEFKNQEITVIVKPTHECNFKCPYCYIPSEDVEKGYMSDKTLRNMSEQLASNFENIHFIWHGGEPTLMGLEFYEKVKDIQADYGSERFRNGIQTNASLLTEEFLDFFKKEMFGIGFSLDGPKHLHDITRVHKINSSGTFDDVMKAVNLMKRKGIVAGAICVLNRYNINRTDEIYDFFNENKINFKISPVSPAGRAKFNTELRITPQEYTDAIMRLFDRWFYDENSKIRRIYCIQDKIESIVTNKPNSCSTLGKCAESYIGIDPSGNVYPCGRWTGINEFRYGNINETPLNQVLKSKTREKLIKRKDMLIKSECKPCNWKEICNGGCMYNAYLAHGTVFARDLFCESTKMILEYISKSVDSQLMLI